MSWEPPPLPPGYGDFLVDPTKPWRLPSGTRRTGRTLRWQLKQRATAAAMRTAERLSGESVVRVNFPTTAQLEPRWGYGQPPHPQLLALFESRRGDLGGIVRKIDEYLPDLERIPVSPTDETTPAWRQTWMPPFDAALLYTCLRAHESKRYVEVGSGWSTRFASRAISDGGFDCQITSIDPQPRASISDLGARVIQQPLEQADLSVFETLERGDVVFVDGSHRVFTNSDVTVFFLDVLPRLAEGVTVCVHDILWPLDYAPGWTGYHFSEQYLLGALLLAESPWLKVVYPTFFASGCPELLQQSSFGALLKEHALPEYGTTFWLEIGSH